MSARRKLLLVINHLDWFWTHRLPLAEGAALEGWDVTVAAPSAARDPRLVAHGFRGLSLPECTSAGSAAATVLRLHALVRAENIALMHAVTLKYAWLAGLASHGLTDFARVYTIAGLGYLFRGDGVKPHCLRCVVSPVLRRILAGEADRVIFQNPDDEQTLIRLGLARAGSTRCILGSGVDLDQFPCQPERRAGKPLVLLPARLLREKGITVFAEAARDLRGRGIDAEFVVAGAAAPNSAAGLSLAELGRIADQGFVRFVGKVDDMPALYERATLVAYPSWYGEGVPKVLLEAAASGRAIVTTDHPGCREVVRHGENGLLVPTRDARALADAIAELLVNAPERQRMARNGRRRAELLFGVGDVVRDTLAIYEEVIADRRRSVDREPMAPRTPDGLAAWQRTLQ